MSLHSHDYKLATEARSVATIGAITNIPKKEHFVKKVLYIYS